jgi:two-component system chemotaxis response regulator CheV
MANTNILLESGTNELEIVEFTIDEDSDGGTYTGCYGINVAKVLEIIRKPEVTRLPQMPHPCVLGSFNLRERIIPLVDLADWLGKRMIESDQAKVIVTEFNRVTNSFLVSGVNRIHRISWEQVEPPGKHLAEFSSGSITGVVRLDNRIILILDFEKIVADLNPRLGLDLNEAMAESDQSRGKIKVLMADDSAMIRKALSRGLSAAGYEVTTAADGREAFELLSDYKRRAAEDGLPLTDLVDIVVSDIEMPVMDGHNLTKRIKEDPVLKQLPVILFSSLISDALKHKGQAVGADEQISKPDVPGLAKTIETLLTKRRQAGV